MSRARKRKKPARRKSLIGRLILILLLAGVIFQLWFAGNVFIYRYTQPTQTSFMKARYEQQVAERPNFEIWHEWVDYGSISINLKRAVVAAEDTKFVNHNGFDWEGIKFALEKNMDKGKLVAGGSTISQQLAKNLFLSNDRTLLRKGQETVITVMLESLLTKRRILELYLNYAEWGDGLFGAQAASWHYFDKPASALSEWEAARLASMLPRPVHYDKNGVNGTLRSKTGVIQQRMRQVWVPS